jgi:hypothetical protein
MFQSFFFCWGLCTKSVKLLASNIVRSFKNVFKILTFAPPHTHIYGDQRQNRKLFSFPLDSVCGWFKNLFFSARPFFGLHNFPISEFPFFASCCCSFMLCSSQTSSAEQHQSLHIIHTKNMSPFNYFMLFSCCIQ